jgi:hypothetical protein
MPGSTGRHTETRTVTATRAATTSGVITAAAGTFSPEDVGRTITGTGIPAGATVASYQSDTQITASANSTSTGTGTITLGPANTLNTGYAGWSPETYAEASSYSVAAVNAGQASNPTRFTDASTPRVPRGR